MKKRKYYPGALACAAVLTVASAGIGQAWSYFTTYAEASGGYTIHLGDRTEITETFTEWTKHVVIANEESSEPVYIRVRAFCGSQYAIAYSGEGWTQGSDGYYYYNSAVDGGGTTGVLDLKIENIPETPEDKESFNVIVIYESTPVKHHEDGSAYTIEETDWSELVDTGNAESTGTSREAENPRNSGSTRNDGEEDIGSTQADGGESIGGTQVDSGEESGNTGTSGRNGSVQSGDQAGSEGAGTTEGGDAS